MNTITSPQPPAPGNQPPIVIVGGGLTGLISAAHISRKGFRAVALEKASTPGGRAATREKHGFSFNLGPHALYRAGALRRTPESFGVEVTGGVPTGAGGFAVSDGRTHTLPIGLTSLITTGALGVHGKL